MHPSDAPAPGSSGKASQGVLMLATRCCFDGRRQHRVLVFERTRCALGRPARLTHAKYGYLAGRFLSAKAGTEAGSRKAKPRRAKNWV